MMTSLRQWRQYNAELKALMESSDDEQRVQDLSMVENDNDERPFYDNTINERENIEPETEQSVPDDIIELPEYDHDSSSDSGDNFSCFDVDAESDEGLHSSDVVTDLAGWATNSNCTREKLNDLLVILRKQGLRLPKDARTLLQTPRSIATNKKCGGDYLYFGLEDGLLKIIHEQSKHFKKNETITINFSIDGVPLFKSSSVQMWPILCTIKGFDPFVVAVFCGDSKPSSVDEYLSDFLYELGRLLETGLYHDELEDMKVELGAFICDAPARSFLKCIKSHTGYFACERCVIKGEYKQNRVVYNIDENIPPLRTDQAFSNCEYNGHQLRRTPLLEAGIACVSKFPLDYMHLVCLGVVKRILTFFKQGPRECKLSQQQLKLISDRLQDINGKIPREFARQPRSLYYQEKWKATEFRQFLLYTGPLVLFDVVSDEIYTHFLTLTVAMSILLTVDDDFRNTNLEYARSLLIYFVKTAPMLYGEAFVTYNVHSLIHLADDVEHYGSSLNEINAFPYENHLHKIKKSVRNARNPISQMAKRIKELEKSKCKRTPRNIHIHISKKLKDSCFLLKNAKIVFIKEKKKDNTYLCDVVSQNSMSSFFETPCDSRLLNIFLVQKHRRNDKRVLIEHDAIAKKAVCLKFRGQFLVIPMLHGMERW